MKELIDYSKAIVNHGNTARLKELFKKAECGGSYTLAFLGGSITQGSVASRPENCYAYHVYEWFCDTFKDASFTYVNAGIGATTSELGVARVEEDVLSRNPDFLIVEYSVNDAPNEHFMETYESLIRHILSAPCNPALLIVHNVKYDDGENAQDIHARVGAHYDVPCVSMKETIYPLLRSNKVKNREITPDDLHPNDVGHELVASVITYALKAFRAEDGDSINAAGEGLPARLTRASYECSRRFRNTDTEAASIQLNGFLRDDSPQQGIWDCFKRGFRASEKGASITYRVKGDCIAVQYKKTVLKPTPKALCVIDGDVEHAVLLDSNFDETWGDCLYLQGIVEHGRFLSDGAMLPGYEHTVCITISDVPEHAGNDFYLVSVIASGPSFYFLSPLYKHRIWGGNKLCGDDQTGEGWMISALRGAESPVVGTDLTLKKLYDARRDLFGGCKAEEFPLLVKLIDAAADLSIQVHPDDTYAQEKEGLPFGKTECWYILDCPKDAELIIGHNARTREEFTGLISEGRYRELLRRVPIQKGDFIEIEPGTLHAITGGVMLLEVQQASDITYRLYDYDRLENGQKRPLHTEKAIATVTVPGNGVEVISTADYAQNKLHTLIHCRYYAVYKAVVTSQLSFTTEAAYMLACVLHGSGHINGVSIREKDFFLIPSGIKEINVTGNCEVVFVTP